MVNYNYKKRKQPEHRKNLGELPSKDNTKLRFTKIKEQKKQLKDRTTEVKLQTGDEFFFNMQNCYKKNNEVFRTTNIDKDAIKKQILLCDFEIRKAQKRVCINKKNVIHIRYDSDCSVNEYEFQENKADKQYLNELLNHKKELQDIYNKSKPNKL